MHEVPVIVEPSYVRFFNWEGMRDGDALYMKKVGSKGWSPARQSSITDCIKRYIQQLKKQGCAASIQRVTLNCRDGVRLCLMWGLTPEDTDIMVVARHHVIIHGVYFSDFPVTVRIEKSKSSLLTVGDQDGRVVASN